MHLGIDKLKAIIKSYRHNRVCDRPTCPLEDAACTYEECKRRINEIVEDTISKERNNESDKSD